MTPPEQQLVNVLLDDYPMAGLGSITELVSRASGSTTSVARMLGFDGHRQFQAAIRSEVKEMISEPVAKRDVWHNDFREEHFLNRYSRQALENLRCSIDGIDIGELDSYCRRLSDPNRRVFLAGGRISGTLAQYLYHHLQMIRSDVKPLSDGSSWTHDLLEVREGDGLTALDVRRYEYTTLLIGKLCHERGAEGVLLTD